ncbi:MAG: zinc-ribbon domain-containing protein [Treponema sp.]|jgi:hypothetical protein|nr:zinc-ribbon domain-containing protein [Treponema sp.]
MGLFGKKKICPNCGKKVAEEAVACPKCGHKFVGDLLGTILDVAGGFLGGFINGYNATRYDDDD